MPQKRAKHSMEGRNLLGTWRRAEKEPNSPLQTDEPPAIRVAPAALGDFFFTRTQASRPGLNCDAPLALRRRAGLALQPFEAQGKAARP